MLLSTTSLAQQAAAAGEPLAIHTVSLPKALLRQQYRFELRAEGGISPLHWEVTGGSLPDGLALSADGVLSGVISALDIVRHLLQSKADSVNWNPAAAKRGNRIEIDPAGKPSAELTWTS